MPYRQRLQPAYRVSSFARQPVQPRSCSSRASASANREWVSVRRVVPADAGSSSTVTRDRRRCLPAPGMHQAAVGHDFPVQAAGEPFLSVRRAHLDQERPPDLDLGDRTGDRGLSGRQPSAQQLRVGPRGITASTGASMVRCSVREISASSGRCSAMIRTPEGVCPAAFAADSRCVIAIRPVCRNPSRPAH